MLAGGTYARKQIFSRSRLVAWSHRSRFALAARLVTPFAGGRLLDYGCGDGTFVALVHDRFAHVVAADVDADLLADCGARLREAANVVFVPQQALAGSQHEAAYDVITCMEVFEHCVDAARVTVLHDLRRLVRPGGRVIISVPIETGPTLVAKQLARRIAAWRGIGDYRYSERYTWTELARMAVASGGGIPRPVYTSGSDGAPYEYHGHKGFRWRALEEEVRAVFRIDARRYSPLPFLGPVLNSQAWLVCSVVSRPQHPPGEPAPVA